ncbi:Hypothetical_protein [Hexamita inflata]|uniref:Hypothetical_protein n=1 Tax=Hexamita inflata TaxID=28002 RepID=A0AA86PWB0_9EUKA|nr:Hypothetical protein HINF_LOCUS29319 [Hexamita inflata]
MKPFARNIYDFSVIHEIPAQRARIISGSSTYSQSSKPNKAPHKYIRVLRSRDVDNQLKYDHKPINPLEPRQIQLNITKQNYLCFKIVFRCTLNQNEYCYLLYNATTFSLLHQKIILKRCGSKARRRSPRQRWIGRARGNRRQLKTWNMSE